MKADRGALPTRRVHFQRDRVSELVHLEIVAMLIDAGAAAHEAAAAVEILTAGGSVREAEAALSLALLSADSLADDLAEQIARHAIEVVV
jgi:hypothetical protein